MEPTYQASWPVDPELLPWWCQTDPAAECDWRNSRIPRLRELYLSLVVSWVIFAIVLMFLQTHPVDLLPWLFMPTMAVALSLVRVPIPIWLLMLYLLGVVSFVLMATYAGTHSAVDRMGTMTVFVVMAAFYALLPLIGRSYAAAARFDRAIPISARGCQVFGRAGSRLAHAQPGWRPAAVRSGILGETLTAEILENYVTRIPGAKIFHSLAWPGSVRADVDHAVLCGRRLLLIDSKHWSPGFYSFAENGSLLRNGYPFLGSEVHLSHAIFGYQRLLPRLEVRGMILIHPNRKGAVDVSASPIPRIDAVNVLSFLNGPCGWLAEEPTTVYTAAVALLWSMTRS